MAPENQGSFVARIWLEGASADGLKWRGHVQHVQGDEECYFQSISTMRKFLERVSGVSLPEGDDQ